MSTEFHYALNTLPVPQGLAPDAAAVRGRRFVWLLAPPWDGLWTRQNHFAVRLARLGAEILYVENAPGWSATLRRNRWRGLLPGLQPTVREAEPGVHVMRPPLTLPGTMRSDIVARLNALRLAVRLRLWLRRRGWNRYLCWCRLPHSLFALQRLEPCHTVYDVTDDYELYEPHPRARHLLRERERQLAARAGTLFVTSQSLLTKDTLGGAPASWIPNGVDYEVFAQAARPGRVHPRVAALGPPVIGYVGLTSHWMDFDLLALLGRRWPNHVVMVGPIAAAVEKQARAIPGVVWAGFVPQKELPPYLRGFDVCILPHLVNALRQRANPLKIWEYLATGKPFVSVDLPALEPARPFADIARDREHFVELVAERLASGATYPLEAAQAMARRYCWDALFAQVLRHLQAGLAPGTPQPPQADRAPASAARSGDEACLAAARLAQPARS
jgi:glycosyltransferase involved in cell wall biosynthesis